ncbi:hypothetical protein P692DRAFT_20912127 [Suillus brevipes Sb2]|nr:hypothetical protein P692DRAFT_20912127 [Suillus brevipes Sb2]
MAYLRVRGWCKFLQIAQASCSCLPAAICYGSPTGHLVKRISCSSMSVFLCGGASGLIDTFLPLCMKGCAPPPKLFAKSTRDKTICGYVGTLVR